jgi:hypothetical protein
MEVVLQWCKGAKFSEICKLTDVFEGSIIRCFRRLQELLRQMGMAAAAIGNTELEEKFAKSLEMLERPNTVVFNPSYVSIDLLWECMLTCLDCICKFFCNTTWHICITFYTTSGLPFAIPTCICFAPLPRCCPAIQINLIPSEQSCRPIS